VRPHESLDPTASRAEVDLDRGADGRHRAVVVGAGQAALVAVVALDEGEDLIAPPRRRPRGESLLRLAVDEPGRGLPGCATVGHVADLVVVRVEGEADVVEVALTLGAGGRLADFLDGGEEQADQDGDNRYHYQQLDQREGTTPSAEGEET